MSRKGFDVKFGYGMRSRSQRVVQDSSLVPVDAFKQSCWANMPPELLRDVLMRIEESEATWPTRKNVVACAGVCRNWREIMKEIVKTLEVWGKLTFPISLKQDAISQRLAEASLTPLSEDGSSTDTVNVDESQMFLDIEGVNKKRRVYSLGSATSAYIDTAASSRARSSSSQPVQMMPDEEIDRRVQAGIEERLQQMTAEMTADFETRMETRMAGLVRAELAKLMPTLPPEFRPPTHPPGDDDDTSAV